MSMATMAFDSRNGNSVILSGAILEGDHVSGIR